MAHELAVDSRISSSISASTAPTSEDHDQIGHDIDLQRGRNTDRQTDHFAQQPPPDEPVVIGHQVVRLGEVSIADRNRIGQPLRQLEADQDRSEEPNPTCRPALP